MSLSSKDNEKIGQRQALFNSWFIDSSVGKESACNAGDPSSISGSGRSPGEGIGYPLQYSWASLVAQPVKNPPAMWKTWVWSLSWEDPLEKGKATLSSILAWRIPRTVQSMGSQRVGHNWATFIFTYNCLNFKKSGAKYQNRLFTCILPFIYMSDEINLLLLILTITSLKNDMLYISMYRLIRMVSWE